MSNRPAKKRPLYINYSGQALLGTSLLNKGSAFSTEERRAFNIEGLLPGSVETIEQQEARVYQQYLSCSNDLDKHIYLRNLQDENETLYFHLVTKHIEEMLPIIYTPTVGLACQKFSQIYRMKRGLFLNYSNKDRIEYTLQNITKPKVKIIVITDSERILGLGDQGIGGMGIPIGKLALYTACGGISPAYTLPVTIDVGTNNQELLDDPVYMGWRHERLVGDNYFDFIDQFIQSALRRWPDVLFQFEDFAQSTATPLLHKYKEKICCFNDDIQGTAAVTVGTLLAACHKQKTSIKDHRIVFVGAGSAACGIADQICRHMVDEGLSEQEAKDRVYLTNRNGLVTHNTSGLKDFQKPFAKELNSFQDINAKQQNIDLLDLVKSTKPTILIGVSGAPGVISEPVVQAMLKECPNPIILPLSNPTSRVEALPTDLFSWTKGKALVATGSPFDPVEYEGQSYPIAQCNNSYIFPGVGLGVIASRAKRVTDKMFMASSEALAACSPAVQGHGETLLPPIDKIREVSRHIAFEVGKQAIQEGVADPIDDQTLKSKIEQNIWEPKYRNYSRIT